MGSGYSIKEKNIILDAIKNYPINDLEKNMSPRQFKFSQKLIRNEFRKLKKLGLSERAIYNAVYGTKGDEIYANFLRESKTSIAQMIKYCTTENKDMMTFAVPALRERYVTAEIKLANVENRPPITINFNHM